MGDGVTVGAVGLLVGWRRVMVLVKWLDFAATSQVSDDERPVSPSVEAGRDKSIPACEIANAKRVSAGSACWRRKGGKGGEKQKKRTARLYNGNWMFASIVGQSKGKEERCRSAEHRKASLLCQIEKK